MNGLVQNKATGPDPKMTQFTVHICIKERQCLDPQQPQDFQDFWDLYFEWYPSP